jgi:hypothetical protein
MENQVRLIKMFGLAAIAAVVAMAFIGASSASATYTALCKEHVALGCPDGQVYTGHVEATSNHAELLASGLNILCKKSHVLGEALGLASDTADNKSLIIHVSLLGFGECTDTVEVLDQVGTLLVLKTALNLGTGTASGFVVLVEKFGLHCLYGGIATGAHALGGNPATIVATKIELEKKSLDFFCPSEASWDATYTVTLPKPIYITE